MLVAVGSFFVTRAVAASNQRMSIEDAAEWYSRGQQKLAGGDLDRAIDALRRATVRDRTDKTYQLALARALARNHDDESARALLLTLREADPEDAEINLELARIAADRHDVTEALRFYHNALYAPWADERAGARREARFELIRFLIAHNQTRRAQAELLSVTSDLPDRADLRVEVGQFFAQAGDDAHALEQFQRALRAAPNDLSATVGAGEAAFRLGQYALAHRYLRSVLTADLTPQIVERVLADDPLAARIPVAERRRRLAADVDYVRQRLEACGGDAALQDEAQDFARRLTPRSPLDQDAIETGVDLVARVARHLVDSCPRPLAPRDRALVLIGREHGSDAK